MSTIKIPADFPDRPEVQIVGPLAAYLHICGLAYCRRFLTDGRIPAAAAFRLIDTSGLARINFDSKDEAWIGIESFEPVDVLVRHGLWERHTDGGYYIPEYLERHPGREQIVAQRAKRQAAGRKGGLARGRQEQADDPDEQA